MYKNLVIFLIFCFILKAKLTVDGHSGHKFDQKFDQKKHYRLSLKESQKYNVHDSIKQFSEDKE